MSNNTISTNISISNNSTDQMMEGLSIKRTETLHISDPEKNIKPSKRANCRLFCSGFLFGLISTLLIFAVTLYVFDYMGTIILEMPYSPWRHHPHSSSSSTNFNRTGNRYTEGSLVQDESGHSQQRHHFDPISRSYVLPDRLTNSTSSTFYQGNNTLRLIQSQNPESSVIAGDLAVNSGNDVDVTASYNGTIRFGDDYDNSSNNSNNSDISEEDGSHHPFEPIQFDDKDVSIDSLYNNQVRRDGKTIDLSQRSTPSTPSSSINVTIYHNNASETSSPLPSIETISRSSVDMTMMVMETTNTNANFTSASALSANLSEAKPVIAKISPNSEITMVTREILNYTNDQMIRINGGVTENNRSLTNGSSKFDDMSTLLPPNIATTMTIGFIENAENISTFDGLNGSQEKQPVPLLTSTFPVTSTESPTTRTRSMNNLTINADSNAGQDETFGTHDNFSQNKSTNGSIEGLKLNKTIDKVSPQSSRIFNTNDTQHFNNNIGNNNSDNIMINNDEKLSLNSQNTSLPSTPSSQVTQSSTLSTRSTTMSTTTTLKPPIQSTEASPSPPPTARTTIEKTSTSLTTKKSSPTTPATITSTTTHSSNVLSSTSESDTRTGFDSIKEATNDTNHKRVSNGTSLLMINPINGNTDQPFNQTKSIDNPRNDNNSTKQLLVNGLTTPPSPVIVETNLDVNLTTESPSLIFKANYTNADANQYSTSTISAIKESNLEPKVLSNSDGLNGRNNSLDQTEVVKSNSNVGISSNLPPIETNYTIKEPTQLVINPIDRLTATENSTFTNNTNPKSNSSETIDLSVDKMGLSALNTTDKGTNVTFNWEQETNETNFSKNETHLNPETESVNVTSSIPGLVVNGTITPELVGNLTDSLYNGTEKLNITKSNEDHVSNTMESIIGTTPNPLECNAKQIRCFVDPGKEACLSADVICDGIRDCVDGSDESDCTNSCGSNFKCGNESKVTCISRKNHCDGLWDCDDGSDESNCYFPVCESDLSCADKSSCLLPIQVCDGKYDCRDHSDEQECTDHSTCLSVGKFFCDNMCIEYSLRCDGSKDCLDGADESNCTCTAEEYKCWNGDCIDKTFVCDGQATCKDGSDEWSCVKTDENNVVSMINPITGNWALVCADESAFGESGYSLLCQKMGLESAINYSTAIVKTIGEVEWVTFNGTMVIPTENCNLSSILILECQTFKCSMMVTPIEPSSSPSPPLSPLISTTFTPVPVSSSTAAASTTTASTTNTTYTTATTNLTMITTTPASVISSSQATISSTIPISSQSPPTTISISTQSSIPTSTVSPSSTIAASLLALPAVNHNVPLSRPTRATSPNEIQSMVIIETNRTESKKKNQCLAQIISPMWLLSSAECLRQFNDAPLIVKANSSRFHGIVERVVLHPHTSKFRYLHIRDFDLALINLKRPLPLSSSLMSSICLPESDVASDITCFMPVLGETEARPYLIQDRSLCNENRHFNASINQRQICASPSDETPDSVPDPGSNLVCLSSSTEWFIGGFVSYASPRTSYTKHPCVFSNVFAMKDFINQVVANHLYQSKMESYNYTFDLSSPISNNDTINNGSISNYDELDKSTPMITHDNLKEGISDALNNSTGNIANNQPFSNIDMRKTTDRSRSLNLDSENSSIYTEINENLTTNVSSANTIDQLINHKNNSFHTEIKIENQQNDSYVNFLRSEKSRSIDLNGIIDRNSTIPKELENNSTSETLTTTQMSLILGDVSLTPSPSPNILSQVSLSSHPSISSTSSPLPSSSPSTSPLPLPSPSPLPLPLSSPSSPPSPLSPPNSISSFLPNFQSTSSAVTLSPPQTPLHSSPMPSTVLADKTSMTAIKTSKSPSTLIVDNVPNTTSKL